MTGPAIPPRASYGPREAMPADGFLDSIGKFDLDKLGFHLEGAAGVALEMRREREQIAALAARMFAGEFRPVVEWLIDITLRRPVFMPGLGPDALTYVAHREGGNAVAWQLLQAIAEGRQEQPPAREGL